MKKILFIFVIVLGIALLSWSNKSSALGDTEEGILWGVLGTVTLGKILNNQSDSQYYPSNPTGEFPPFRCSGDSVTCSYERGKWEREREEWLIQKDRAYQCGRYPEKCSSP